MNKVLIGPGIRTDTPDFTQGLLDRGVQPGVKFEIIPTDRYATNLVDIVGQDPFIVGPGIFTFNDDEEFMEHLDSRLTDRYEWEGVTLDQFNRWNDWRREKGKLERTGEFLGGVASGAGSIIGQGASAVGEIAGAIGERQGVANTLTTAGESLGRWFTGLGVLGTEIKGTVGGYLSNESEREHYDRFMAQKRLEADLATDENTSLISDFANHVSPEFADSVQSHVMNDAADIGAIAADIVIGAKGATLLPKIVRAGAATKAAQRLASLPGVGRAAAATSAAAKGLSALPKGAARKIAEGALGGAGAVGRHGEKVVRKLGTEIDKMVTGKIGSNATLVGAALAGNIPGALGVAAGRYVGYPALKAAARGSLEATRGAYTAARHILTQTGPHQLNLWQNIMRDAAAPAWVRATAASANHVFGRRGSRIAAAGTHGAMIEAAQESLTEWLADPLDYERTGQAAGAALVLGGAIHGGLNLGNLDGLDAYYRNLDRLDYRQGLQDPTLFDQLPDADQLALSDAAAFLGSEFTVLPLKRSQMAPLVASTGAIPAPDIAAPAGAYIRESGTLAVNVDAARPTGATILHEVGHAVYDSIPDQAKADFRAALENAYGKETLAQFAADYAVATNKEGLPEEQLIDEMFAEHFMGVNANTPLLLQESDSLPSQARRILNAARGNLFREWANRAQLDPEAPEGLMEFTPWVDDPAIRDLVRRETNNLINQTVADPDPDLDIDEEAPAAAPGRGDSSKGRFDTTQPPLTPKETKAPIERKKIKLTLTRDADGNVTVPPEVRQMESLWNAGNSMSTIADQMGTYKMDISRNLKLFGEHLDLLSLEDNKAIRKGQTTSKRRRNRGKKKFERNARIINLIEKDGKSYREAAEAIGMSHEGVRKVHLAWKAKEAAKRKAAEEAPSPSLSPDTMPAGSTRRSDLIRGMIAGRGPFRAIQRADGSIAVPIGITDNRVQLVDADQATAAALLDDPGQDPHAAYQGGIGSLRAGQTPWSIGVDTARLADLDDARLVRHDGFTGHTLQSRQREQSGGLPVDTASRGQPVEVIDFLSQARNLPTWSLSELGEPVARTNTHADYRHPEDPTRLMRVPAGFSEPTLQGDGTVSVSPRRPLAYIDQMAANRDLGGDVRFEGVVTTPTGPKPLHSLPAPGRPVFEPDVQRFMQGVPEGYRLSPDVDGFRRDPLTGRVAPNGALAWRERTPFRPAPSTDPVHSTNATSAERILNTTLAREGRQPVGPEFRQNFDQLRARVDETIQEHGLITREEMPIVQPNQADAFREFLGDVAFRERAFAVADVRPIQGEIFLPKTVGFAAHQGEFGDSLGAIQNEPFAFVSNDGFILDGNHRWAQAMLIDPNARIRATEVDLPIAELLPLAQQFSASVGNTRATDVGGLDPAPLSADQVIPPRRPTVSLENIPGANSNVLRWLHLNPPQVKQEFHAKVNEAFVDPETGNDIIGEELGISPTVDVSSESAYINSRGELEFNPADQVSGFPDQESAELYALIRGYYTFQEAVAGYAPKGSGGMRGYDYSIGRPLNRDQVADVFRAIESTLQENGVEGGTDDFAFYPRPEGFQLVHLGFNDAITPEIAVEVTDAAGHAAGASTVKGFDTDTFYHENSWEENRNGEAYQTEIEARGSGTGRPDLLTRLDGRLREPLQEVYNEFSKRGLGEAGFQDPAGRPDPELGRIPSIDPGPVERALENNLARAQEGWFHKVFAPALKKAGGQLKASSRNMRMAAKRAMDGMYDFLRSNPIFLDYYNRDWQQTEQLLATRFPEIKERPGLLRLYRTFSGLLSSSTKLKPNQRESISSLEEYLDRGNFDRLKIERSKSGARKWAPGGNVLKFQTATGAHKARTLKIVEQLIKDKGGIEAAIQHLEEPVTMAELHAFNREMGFAGNVGSPAGIKRVVKQATGQDEMIPRMFIFGQKVGAYTLNSLGHNDYTTTDIWEGRFVRSFFRNMIAQDADGLPTTADEHRLFQEFSSAFLDVFKERTGLDPEKSALQAMRWFYMIDAARRGNYRAAQTNNTISGYVKEVLGEMPARPNDSSSS